LGLEGHLGTLFVDIQARNRMKGEIGRIGNQMRAVGRTMSMYVTLPIIAAGTMAVKTAAEFEVSMRQIAVATGAPNKELKVMGKLAIKLGADTIYSANEAAEAMLELAKSGITPAQIKAGALKETLNLAAASGLDMAQSAVVMGTTLNAFHLPATRAKEAVDALAGAANASSAEVSDITLALQQVSAMAYQSGLSIQETAAVLAVFADAGIRGSDAGTSFKVFLQRLNPVTGKAKELMDSLGMSFYKGNGEMKPMVGIVKELQDKLGGMTQKQRMSTMQILFGTDAIRAAAVLYDQGVSGMKKYIKETSEVGAASKMAAARMGGIAGALEQLRGSVETAGLIIGKLLAPSIRVVAGALKRLFNAFSALPKPTQKMLILFTAILAVIGPLLIMFGLMASAVSVIMSHALLPFVLILAKVALIIGIVVAVGYVLSKMWKYLVPIMKPVITAFGHIWDSIKELYGLLKPLLIPALKLVAAIVGGALLVAFAGLAIVLSVIVNVIAGVVKVFVGLGKVIWGVGEILWGFITGNRKLMAKGVKDMTAGFSLMGEGAKNAVVDSATAIYDIIKGTVEGIGGMLGKSIGKAADEAEKGGKATGKKYSDGHSKETKKGRKAEDKARAKSFDKREKEAEKQGERESAAYLEGMEGGLVGEQFKVTTSAQKADEEELKANLARRKAYWKAIVKGDFEGAKELLDIADKHQKKADRLRGITDKKAEKDQKDFNRKRQGIAYAGGETINRLLKGSLNKQSGTYILSRKRRLALQKGFLKREQFYQREGNTTMAGIFRFFKEQIANLDRLFYTSANERRKGHQGKQIRGTRVYFNSLKEIVRLGFFGPDGVLSKYRAFGRAVMEWLNNSFLAQWAKNREYWNVLVLITKDGVNRVVARIRNKLFRFRKWLFRVPRMFFNAIVKRMGWLYRAGKKLVNQMIKGIKDRLKAIVGAGKQAGQSTRKGYRKGSKGAGRDGKAAGNAIRRGFRRGTKNAPKDGEKAGKATGGGFKKGSIKGILKAGKNTAKKFMQGLRKSLGIRSPSEEARKLGVATTQGFNEGVNWKKLKNQSAENMEKVTQAMQKKLMKFGKWLKGLPKHWKNILLLNAHYMGEAGTALAKTLIGAVKVRLGIKSPSKEFQKIGKYMIMGLIEGMSQEDLMSILTGQFGGWEKFARHLMELIQGNMGRGWGWLSEFLGTDAQQLMNALTERFGMGGGAMANQVKALVDSVAGDPYVWGGWQPGGFDCSGLISWILNQLGLLTGRLTTAGLPGVIQQGVPGSFEIYGWNGGAGGGHAYGKVLGQWFESGGKAGGVGWLGPNDPYPGRAQYWGIPKGWVEGGGGGQMEGGDIWGKMSNFFDDKWPRQMPQLHELIMRESGFDPNATSSMGAWGLFQFMPFNFPKYLPKGKASTIEDQIRGGFKYISERYPTGPAEALAHQIANQSYAGGGEVSATLHAGERVLTMRQNRWFTALAKPLSALSSGSKMGILPVEVKVAMPTGTTFKIKNLKEGIIEVVDEGIYDHVEKTIGIDEWVDKK